MPFAISRRNARRAFRALAILAVFHAGQVFAQPAITDITPRAGEPAATVVSVIGSGFSETADANVVRFGNVKADVLAVAPSGGGMSTLYVEVPAGAQYGPVTVLNKETGLQAVLSNGPFVPTYSPAPKRVPRPADFERTVLGADATAGVAPVVATADFNGDGRPDLITARATADSNVYLRLSIAGTQNYDTPLAIPALANVVALDVGDVDGDGLLDIVAASSTTGQFVVLQNTGSDSAPAFTPHVITAANASTGLRLADFNNDGRPDVVLSLQGNEVGVFPNTTPATTPDIAFAAPILVDVDSQAGQLAVGDINMDGKEDIIVLRERAADSSPVIVLKGDGALGFTITEVSLATPQQPSTVQVAKILGGNPVDVVLGYDADMVDHQVGVLRNTSTVGTISFDYWPLAIPDPANPGAEPEPVRGMGVGDVDGDDKVDIVVGNGTTGGISIYRNTSSVLMVTAERGQTLTTTASTVAAHVLAGDLEVDGKPDILVVHENGELTQFFNRAVVTPTIQATNIQVLAEMLMPTSATISWVRGSGDKAVVFMAEASAGTPAPVDTTAYTASTSFGAGTQIGTSGWFAIANGTGTSVTVTGLEQDKTYRVMVVEYNTNSFGTNASYRTATATGNPLNVTTPVPVSVTSLVRASTNPTNASTVAYTLTLDGTAYGLGAAHFTLGTTGLTGASVSSVTGSGSTWTISLDTGTGSGTLELDFSNDSGIAPGVTGLPFDGETYTIDRDAPELLTVAIASDNADPGIAHVGDTVTLNFKASEAITPTVQIAGQAVAANNTSGFEWTAQYTVASTDPHGPVTFDIAFVDSVGNAGTSVTATTDASTVVVGVPVVPQPTETLVTGTQSGVDMSGPLHIASTAVIDGGTLSGGIYNSGTITGTVTLGPGTTIQGGTVSGKISGDPAAPAMLREVTIPPGTVLENVTIGRGTVISPDAVVGAGVRFESRDLIPPGLDLTGTFTAFPWSGDADVVVIDLDSDVLSIPTLTLLEALQRMARDEGNALDESGGELRLDARETRGMLLPVRVRQAGRGIAPGTYVDDDGNLLFVTAEGYEVLAWPVLLDDGFFREVLAERGMDYEYDAQGRLIVTPDSHNRYRFLGKAAVAARPAATGSVPGLQPRGTGYVLVFAGDDGVLLEQELVPVAADWPGLRATLEALPGVSDVMLDVNGDITVTLGGRRVTGRMSHQVSLTIADLVSAEVTLVWAGDLDGDGSGDYYVYYPRESLVQVLFVKP